MCFLSFSKPSQRLRSSLHALYTTLHIKYSCRPPQSTIPTAGHVLLLMCACNWCILQMSSINAAAVISVCRSMQIHTCIVHACTCVTLTTARWSLCALVSAFISFLLHAVHSLSEDSLKHSAAVMLKMQLRVTRIFHIFSRHLSFPNLAFEVLFIGTALS